MFGRATMTLGIGPHSSLSIISNYIAEFKLRFYVPLNTNTGLNFLFIVEVPPLGKCRPGRPYRPLSLRHCLN